MIGAGSWGTALAMQFARSGCVTRLWGRDREYLEQMQVNRQNQRYLPGMNFPEHLSAEPDLSLALSDAEIVMFGTPSYAFAENLKMVYSIRPDVPGVSWASKGFEPGSGRFLHEVAQDIVGPSVPLAVATGPSFAEEVANNLPTALVVASTDSDYAERVSGALHDRAYTSTDLIGAELGGAVKNVLAVGTAINDGMGMGANARAAIMTRGLAEMMRLSAAMGAQPETLMGLSGIGDLILTCTGDLSRNRRFGLALGQGKSIEQALEEIGQVVEGARAAKEVVRLAKRKQVELPIAQQINDVINGRITPQQGVMNLLSRDPKAEY